MTPQKDKYLLFDSYQIFHQTSSPLQSPDMRCDNPPQKLHLLLLLQTFRLCSFLAKINSLIISYEYEFAPLFVCACVCVYSRYHIGFNQSISY